MHLDRPRWPYIIFIARVDFEYVVSRVEIGVGGKACATRCFYPFFVYAFQLIPVSIFLRMDKVECWKTDRKIGISAGIYNGLKRIKKLSGYPNSTNHLFFRNLAAKRSLATTIILNAPAAGARTISQISISASLTCSNPYLICAEWHRGSLSTSAR